MRVPAASLLHLGGVIVWLWDGLSHRFQGYLSLDLVNRERRKQSNFSHAGEKGIES